MILEVDRLIKQFYESIKKEYPNLSFETIEKICKAPFLYFKGLIESDDFPSMHIKYFGKFLVYKRNIINIINSLTKRRDKKLITDEEFNEATVKLFNYLKKEDETFDSSN